MYRKGPPNRSRYQLTSGLNRFRQRKRHDNVSLSRQEGSKMHHLANAHPVMGFFCCMVGLVVLTVIAYLHCVRDYKNLIYLILYLQISSYFGYVSNISTLP